MAVQTIPALDDIPEYPQRKDPQDRFDTLIKEAVDGGSKAVSELNTKFIPAYNSAVPVMNWIEQNKTEILAVDDNAASALASKNAAETSAITAITKAGEASTSAASAEAAKVAAEAARDEAQEIVGGNYALATRKISAGTGLSGGGSLEADRTISVEFGTAAGTVCQGNDSRLTNARTPTAHSSTHGYGGSDPIMSLGPVSEKAQALGSVSGPTTINLASGLAVSLTISGPTTLTFTGAPSGGMSVVILTITNGGSAVITWPATIAWPGGIAPVMSTAGVDIVLLETDNGGANWFGVVAGISMGVVA